MKRMSWKEITDDDYIAKKGDIVTFPEGTPHGVYLDNANAGDSDYGFVIDGYAGHDFAYIKKCDKAHGYNRNLRLWTKGDWEYRPVRLNLNPHFSKQLPLP